MINRCKVRMYRAGTGDCFLLKFYAGRERKFTMMIDGGVWQGSKDYLTPFVENIADACNEKLDLLIVTHEHKDHVLFFDRCQEIFERIEIEELWLGWTENDEDPIVKDWKKKYGEKKRALELAAQAFHSGMSDGSMNSQIAGNYMENAMSEARQQFSEALSHFSDLHVSGGEYKGALKGMDVVKNHLKAKKIRFCSQGEIIKNLNNLEGINFYVLGPPSLHREVKVEHGSDGESYDHNKELEESGLFSLSMLHEKNHPLTDDMLPFDRAFLVENSKLQKEIIDLPNTEIAYSQPGKEWRKIDHDWLFSSAQLALRMNSLTNNLSLALAIEFEKSKKVLLFPGDAEFGSWQSWHNIYWPGTLTTKELLSRTVFYKVAHHLSHNGTARHLGLDLMSSENLVAMATLDYSNISSGWKNTMPNRHIIQDLLAKTKGRLILMNEEEIFYDFAKTHPIKNQIESARRKMNPKEWSEFEKDLDIPKAVKVTRKGITKEVPLYYEYSIDGR